MNRDELIEQMAEIVYEAEATDDEETFVELGETLKQTYREFPLMFWPLIVTFGADWIESQGQVHHEILLIEGSSLAATWREEMMS